MSGCMVAQPLQFWKTGGFEAQPQQTGIMHTGRHPVCHAGQVAQDNKAEEQQGVPSTMLMWVVPLSDG